MAQVKNSFAKAGTAKNPPEKKNFWDRLLKWAKEDDSKSRQDRVYPKNADERITMLAREIENLEQTLKNSKKASFEEKEKEYEALTVLQRALRQKVENQPSFVNFDCMKIDACLFELCQSADEAIQRGHHSAAIWAMRGLSSGLVDGRSDISMAELSPYKTSADPAGKVLAEREKRLKKYIEIVNEYSWIDQSSQELSKRKNSLEKKNADYKESYAKLEALRKEERGQVAENLLAANPMAAATDPDARELDELIRIQTVKWIACEVEEELIKDLRLAIEALEKAVITMRSTIHSSKPLSDFLKSSLVVMENALKEAHENRMGLYEDIGNYQEVIDSDRNWQKSFQNSALFIKVSGNAQKQLNLLQEKQEADQREKDAIEKEVKERQKILADERKHKAEEANRIAAEVKKAEAEAGKAEAEARKAEAKKVEDENEKAKAALAAKLHA